MARWKSANAAEKKQSLEKLAYRPKEFQRAYGVAKSYVYDQMARGRLKVIKAGKATLITREAIEEWLALCASETEAMRGTKRIA